METRADNPGQTTRGRIEFENDGSTWVEEFDLVELLASVLADSDIEVNRHETFLETPQLGLQLAPQLVDIEILPAGGVHTCTTLEFRHSTLFPEGLFEFQHASDDDVVSSLTKGLKQWAASDLFAIADAVDTDRQRCAQMELEFPEGPDRQAIKRRIVLGPVSWAARETAAEPDAAETDSENHPPHCPCCLLTNSWDSLGQELESDDTIGIRFYSMRDDDGGFGADCRVNGLDHAGGKQALVDYAATWSGEGFEMRRQYVLVTTSR